MHLCTEILFIGLFLVKRSLCINDCVFKPKIAIIGGGIGGASASYFLTKLFNENVKIDIFESRKIGGRLATLNLMGNEYEVGGAVIHPRNKYMKNFVKLAGLEAQSSSRETKYGIWNGQEGNRSEIYEMAGYNQVQLSDLYRHVGSFLDKFDNIYNLQENQVAFKNVTALLSAMNPEFSGLLEISMAKYLRSLGFSSRIINELVQATLVQNYGQSTDVHSFVGLVSLAGAGAVAEGTLWSVKGGNEKVPKKLILQNRNVKQIVSRVTAIRYLLSDEFKTQYEITYKSGGTPVMKKIYDSVVIATKLTQDHDQPIKFLDFPEHYSPPFPGNYQTIQTTLIKSDIRKAYFGAKNPIDAIMSCDPRLTGINSVSKQCPVDGQANCEPNSTVSKVFSANRRTSDVFPMFEVVYGVSTISWKAYPTYSTNPRLDKFELYDSLYHVNAIEWAASAMEMSAIGGRNVALLIYENLSNNRTFTPSCEDRQQQTEEQLYDLSESLNTFAKDLNIFLHDLTKPLKTLSDGLNTLIANLNKVDLNSISRQVSHERRLPTLRLL